MTATAAAYDPSMPSPVLLYVTCEALVTADLMPCRIVVPGVIAPLEPCQLIVQPPLWLPMSSADLPATKTFADLASGSTPPSFFSSTCDSRTACRATARCAAEPTVEV